MGELKRRYSLFTAIAMVVGITIGSGVFFKADDVLVKTGGNLKLAILAWLIGGAIMIVGGYTFSLVARRVSKVNGLIDYVEAGYGDKVGYYVGWFQAIIYYPTLTGVLAWVAGLYTDNLFNLNGEGIWYIAIGYLLSIFSLNYLSPLLAGKFQVSTTIFKLVPLVLIAIVGTIAGLMNGMTVENFTASGSIITGETGLAVAVLSTAFAYEGWVIASSINAELKNPKRDLPKALFFGSLIVVLVYITYYIGLSSIIENEVFIIEGDYAVSLAVTSLFGKLAGTVLIVFVIVSCLGTLNGLMIGVSRGMYSLAYRNNGPKPELFKRVNGKSGAPENSTIFGLIVTLLWLIVWYGNFQGWYGEGRFLDTSELPIALLYTAYILVYIWIMRTFKDLNFIQRFIVPSLATLGALFIIYGAVQKDLFIAFMVITIFIMFMGYLLNSKKLK
jgi:APA family basic amino acid/polyamine antiporter